MAVFIAGVTLVKAYETPRRCAWRRGDTARLAGYDFRFASIEEVSGPNYTAARGAVEVTRRNGRLTKLHPEKRLYLAQPMPMTEAAPRHGLPAPSLRRARRAGLEREWVVRLQHKPFVGWIWLGAC